MSLLAISNFSKLNIDYKLIINLEVPGLNMAPT